MILDNGPYIVAFILTASIHISWPSIPFIIHQQFSLLLSSRPSASEVIIKVHMFALLLLVFSLSFKTTSAALLVPCQATHTYNVCLPQARSIRSIILRHPPGPLVR